MALREDVGLSALLLVSVPALVILVGSVVARMVPQFQRMQDRIDTVNRVLREQQGAGHLYQHLYLLHVVGDPGDQRGRPEAGHLA